jgi:hypothetical protein
MMTQRPDPHPQEVMDILQNKSQQTRIAVVGASNNPEKYGNIIVRNLKEKGYKVLPVNPKQDEIEGLPVYHSLDEIDQPVDIIDFVTPPKVTLRMLEAMAALDLKNAWLQDGSYDDEVLDFVAKAPFKTVYDACIMVASNH